MLSPVSNTLGVVAGGLILCASLGVRAQDVESFISTERPIALQGALNNIGPDGSQVPGAGAGLVVASPSKVNPDCEFLPLPISDSQGLTLMQTSTLGRVTQL